MIPRRKTRDMVYRTEVQSPQRRQKKIKEDKRQGPPVSSATIFRRKVGAPQRILKKMGVEARSPETPRITNAKAGIVDRRAQKRGPSPPKWQGRGIRISSAARRVMTKDECLKKKIAERLSG